MLSEKSSGSNPKPSPQPKPATSSSSATLTPSEIERLRQIENEWLDSLQKAYPGLRIHRPT